MGKKNDGFSEVGCILGVLGSWKSKLSVEGLTHSGRERRLAGKVLESKEEVEQIKAMVGTKGA